MNKILLLIFIVITSLTQLFAQERNTDVEFVKHRKEGKGFTPSLVFNQKYIPGDTVVITFDINYQAGTLTNIDLKFPEGTTIIAASPVISAYSSSLSMVSSVQNTTIVWYNAQGIDYSYTPLLGTLKVILPATASGDLLLNCSLTALVGNISQTAHITATLNQLPNEPLLALSANNWYAGVSQVSATVTSDASLTAYNMGANDLIITSISGLNTPFSNNTSFPLTIGAQSSKALSIKFDPDTSGYFENAITINSNGGNQNLLASGAAYDGQYTVVDFEDVVLQFPPAGWSIDSMNCQTAWSAVNRALKLEAGSNGTDSSLFVSPAIDLSTNTNLFIGFDIQAAESYEWNLDVLYSTDGKQSWQVLDENINKPLGKSGQYYHSLNGINGQQVYLAIKGKVTEGLIFIDNLVVPNYYNPNTIPSVTQMLYPVDGSNNVSIATDFGWDKVLFADGYRLYLDTLPNPVKYYDLGNVTRYKTSLKQLTYYYWKVVPYNAYGTPDDCPVWSFKTEQFVPTSFTKDAERNTQITFVEGAKYNAMAHALSNGETFLTWRAYEDGNVNMKAQILDADGHEKFRRNGMVISNNKQATFWSSYDGLVDKNDNLVTAFIDIRSGSLDAYIYKVSPTGDMLWGNNGIALTDSIDRDCYNPSVQKDTANNIYVSVLLGNKSILKKFDPNGNAVWSNTYMSTDNMVNWTVMPNGEIYTLNISADKKIYLNYFDANMVPKFQSPVLVSNAAMFGSNPNPNVQLAVDKHRGIYVVWQAYATWGPIIKWQYVRNDQSLLNGSGGTYISTNMVRNRAYPKLIYREKIDKLIVTWDEFGATLNNGLYAQRVNNQGVYDFGETGKTIIEVGDSIAGTDAIAIKGDTILWYFSNFKPGTAFGNYLNVMFLDENMNAIDGLDTIRYSTYNNNKPLDAVAVGKNQAVMVWDEERPNTGSQIFVQNLHYDGTLGLPGPDTIPPLVKKIEVLSNEKILISFDEELLADSAQMNDNYWLTGPGAPIVTYSELYTPTKVLLKIQGWTGGQYFVYMKNLTDLQANTQLLDSIGFTYTPDFTLPQVTVAKPVANDKLVVRFSEPITDFDLTDTNNYSITNSSIINITRITNTQIVLQTNTLINGNYTLTISHINDLMENPLADTSITLQFVENSGNLDYFRTDFTDGIPQEFSLYNLDQANPQMAQYFTDAWVALGTTDGNVVAASTSYYNPPAQADDWMVSGKITIQKNAYLFWDALSLSAQFSEGYEIWVSTTGYDPSDFQIKVYEVPQEHYEWRNRFVDISRFGFGDENIYVAFRNHTDNKYILFIDNIALYSPYNNDIALQSISVPTQAMGGSELAVTGSVQARGINPTDDFMLNWQLNEGEIYSQLFDSLNLVIGKSISITHAQKVILPADGGTYTLKVWTSLPNGIEDENRANDTLITKIVVQQGYEQRLVLLEHFTNTDCGPCGQLNPILDELLEQNDNAGKVLHLSYHVWWPGINDPFFKYNKSDVVARKDYYDTDVAPSVALNGGFQLLQPNEVTQEMINEQYALPGLLKIEGGASYMTDRDLMRLNLKLTNLDDFTATNPVVFAVIAQSFETETPPGTNGETRFDGVMRDIITSNVGDALENRDSAAVNLVNYDFPVPAEFNVGNAFIGIFVQDELTGEVYMATKGYLSQSYQALFNVRYGADAIAGAQISINNQTLVTDMNGTDSIPYLLNGTYQITVTKEGFQTCEGTVEINSQNVVRNVELQPTSIINQQEPVVSVYPNPATRSINISGNTIIESITIINLQGKELKHFDINPGNSINLNMSEFDRGCYFISIKTGTTMSLQKIVLQ